MNFSSASAFGAILLSAVTMFGQASSQPVQVGYAVITPSTPVASGMVVYQTFSQTRGGETVQVGVLPAPGGFSSQIGIPAEFNGTLVISSTSPVSIVGLKFRGSNPSAIPVTDLSPTTTPIPTILPGVGGLGAVLFPQFVTGGDWTTEIVIANTTAVSLTVRLDVFTQGGSPLTVTLNGQTGSSFPNLVIPANGLLKIAP